MVTKILITSQYWYIQCSKSKILITSQYWYIQCSILDLHIGTFSIQHSVVVNIGTYARSVQSSRNAQYREVAVTEL